MNAHHIPTPNERLIDVLQTALPLVQRLLVMNQQNVIDARRALEALENASAIVITTGRREAEQAAARLRLDAAEARQKGGAR